MKARVMRFVNGLFLNVHSLYYKRQLVDMDPSVTE